MWPGAACWRRMPGERQTGPSEKASWRRMPGERQAGPSEKARDLARDALAEF